MRSRAELAAEPQITAWLGRISGEYRESPGLRLTIPEASRLWGLDDLVCAALLAALVDAGVLHRTTAGAFVRATPLP